MVDNNLPVNCLNTWENDTLATLTPAIFGR